MANTKYDVAVIGSGPGGYVAAIRCAQLGLKTAIIEKNKTFGGTCLNVGCIPSKALLDSTELLFTARNNMKKHGIIADNIHFDLNQMMARKDEVVSKMTNGVEILLKNYKIDTYEGFGKLKSNHIIIIEKPDGKKIEIESVNVILATGSVPIELSILPFDHDKIVDSTDALSFKQVPQNLAVIGAGAIGLEIGSIWNRLGSTVVVIELMDQILPQSDSNSSHALAQILEKQGLDFKLSTKVTSADIQNGKIKLKMKDKNGADSELLFDKVLAAAGRKPDTGGLGLDETGIQTDPKSGQIIINKNYQTNAANIFAIGDIVKGPMLAHKASEEGIAAAGIIAKGYGAVNYEAIPAIIYTSPEYAAVGKREDELIKEGVSYKSGIFKFRANGRALAGENTDGFVKIFSSTKDDRLLGGQIIGPWASDLIGEIVTVMEFNGSSEDIARTIHAHPALSEVVKEAAMDVQNWSIHTLPKLRKILD
jgi:dihydrolipoamide dehydrogenase